MKNKNNKSSKSSKSTNKTNKTISRHLSVAKGVYKQPSGTYAVRPTINGKRMHITFKTIKAAKAYLKTIN